MDGLFQWFAVVSGGIRGESSVLGYAVGCVMKIFSVTLTPYMEGTYSHQGAAE
jgi:hypothetical protein